MEYTDSAGTQRTYICTDRLTGELKYQEFHNMNLKAVFLDFIFYNKEAVVKKVVVSSRFLYLFGNSSNNLHELHIMSCPNCQGQSGQRSGLMEGRQADGDIEEQGGDTQPHLAPAHGSQGQGSSSDVRRQTGGPTGLHSRGRYEEEGGDAQQAVVELDTGWVLGDVPHRG